MAPWFHLCKALRGCAELLGTEQALFCSTRNLTCWIIVSNPRPSSLVLRCRYQRAHGPWQKWPPPMDPDKIKVLSSKKDWCGRLEPTLIDTQYFLRTLAKLAVPMGSPADIEASATYVFFAFMVIFLAARFIPGRREGLECLTERTMGIDSRLKRVRVHMQPLVSSSTSFVRHYICDIT